MAETDADRVALRFVNEINRQDVTALTELMAANFRYVDGLGQEVRGRERMRERWTSQFAGSPDFRIVIRDHLSLGSVVALFGTASGTYNEPGAPTARNRWSVPGAWRAVVRDGRVEEWCDYCDHDPAHRPADPGLA